MMQRKLSKQWGPYAPGTVVVDNLTDAGASPGSIQVNAVRMATLEDTGYFEPAEPVRPIPEEVVTGGGADNLPDYIFQGARRRSRERPIAGEMPSPPDLPSAAPEPEPASTHPNPGEPAKEP